MNIRKFKLEIATNSCSDYILYYGIDKNVGFEVKFDDNSFNGIISFCDDIGIDNEEWNIVEDKEIYEFIKEKAMEDFEKIVNGENKNG